MAKQGSIKHYRQTGSAKAPPSLPFGELAVAKDGTLFVGNENNTPILAGIQMKLVWKNASPASTFPPQSVIIDMQSYDTLLINCTLGANLVVRKGNTSSVMVSTGFNYYRGIICNEYGVIFDNCGYFANYGNFTQTIENAALIPIEIYGIRGVL